jgi:hypothetical protein
MNVLVTVALADYSEREAPPEVPRWSVFVCPSQPALTVIDEFTRRCLAIVVAHRLRSDSALAYAAAASIRNALIAQAGDD